MAVSLELLGESSGAGLWDPYNWPSTATAGFFWQHLGGGVSKISPSCQQGLHIFFRYTITANWGKWYFMKKLHFLQRLTYLLLHINYRGIPLPFGIVEFGGCKTSTFQQAHRCRCRSVKITISMLFFSLICQQTLFFRGEKCWFVHRQVQGKLQLLFYRSSTN